MIRLPGLVDLQVNGFAGVDFSSPDLTRADAVKACGELSRRGVAGFLPTIITSSEETYARNLPILADLASDAQFGGMILGIHAEGPFISKEPGAVGAHNPAWARNPDRTFLGRMMEWSAGSIRMLTIAAELPGAEALAAYAVSRGIVVALGHQLAGAADLARVAQAGARLITHFGNGMPNLVHRHENILWAGLAEDRLGLSLITDGHHLPPSIIKTALRVKGVQQIVVVSDASPAAGLPPGRYHVLGNEAVLEPSGRLHNPEKACLVGSSASILECANYLLAQLLATPEEVAALCLHNPLRLLGRRESDLPHRPGIHYDSATKGFVLDSEG